MNKKDLKLITIIFLVSRILLIVFLIINHKVNNYDALNYMEIAKNGYSREALYAFFPLYPLLIKVFHFIIPSYEIASILVSNICSYLSILVLYKLIEKNKYKYYILVAYIFSPILVFNMIGYTESLYLLLTLLSFYLYKENKYLLTGILLGLSMLTRNTGIVLLGAIGLHMLYRIYKKEVSIKDLIILTIPAVLIGFSYSIYLYIETKDFFKYITVQYTEWDREKSNLILLIINDIKNLLKSHNTIYIYVFIQNWLFYFIGIFLGIKYLKKEPVLSIYLIVSLLLITTTSRTEVWMSLPSISFFRYVFGLFSVYLLVNTKDNKIIKNPIVISLYLTTSIVNSLLVFCGAFIA